MPPTHSHNRSDRNSNNIDIGKSQLSGKDGSRPQVLGSSMKKKAVISQVTMSEKQRVDLIEEARRLKEEKEKNYTWVENSTTTSDLNLKGDFDDIVMEENGVQVNLIGRNVDGENLKETETIGISESAHMVKTRGTVNFDSNKSNIDVDKLSADGFYIQSNSEFEKKGNSPVVELGKVAKEGNRRAWSEIAKPKAQERMKFEYHSPQLNGDKVFVKIPLSVGLKGRKAWENYLVGYFFERRVPFHVMEYHANRRWRNRGLIEVIMNDDGFFSLSSNWRTIC